MGKWFHGHDHIVLDVRDAGVAYVTLNRPEKRNAITADMLDALRAALMRRLET